MTGKGWEFILSPLMETKELKKNSQSVQKEKKLLKILMLHGYFQSGEIFKKKTGTFR